MKHSLVLLALAACFAVDARAASAPAPPENLVACSRMAEAAERLRCYDTQMAAMMSAASGVPPAALSPAPKPEVAAVPPPIAPTAPSGATAAPPPAAPPPPAVAPPTEEQKFGAVDLPRAAREKVDQSEKVLRSTIVSIRQVRPKLWLIVLANGQIWLQDGTQITMFFRSGYEVRIERGLLEGEFRMSSAQVGDKSWVKVSRVQ